MEATLEVESTRSSVRSESLEDLSYTIPTPFPSALASHRNAEFSNSGDLAEEAQDTPQAEQEPVKASAQSSDVVDSSEKSNNASGTVVETDLEPSLEYLRESCLTALLDLFPAVDGLDDRNAPVSILALRRHSEPAVAYSLAGSSKTLASPLERLLSNLRSRDPFSSPLDDEDVLSEVQMRVQAATSVSLHGLSAEIAVVLASLLVNIEKLSTVNIRPSSSRPQTAGSQTTSLHVPQSTRNFYENLGKRVESIQSQQLHKSLDHLSSKSKKYSQIQQLWASIDQDMETVLKLCRQRSPSPGLTPDRGSMDDNMTPNLRGLGEPDAADYFDHLPPEYDYQEDLPQYDPFTDFAEHSSLKLSTKGDHTEVDEQERPSEKMRMDLESLTSAIDRLYMVAPQLHNQRVELKTSKLQQMERARQNGSRLRNVASEGALELETAKLVGRGRIASQTAEPSKRFSVENGLKRVDVKGKGKAREFDTFEMAKSKSEDLDRILHLIGKSTGDQRRIVDQRVDFGDFKSRMERVKFREQKEKEQLAERMVRHASAGRLSSQEYIPSRRVMRASLSATREDEPLLSLPEFMEEALPPASLSRALDPNAMLTLPEFFREQNAHFSARGATSTDAASTVGKSEAIPSPPPSTTMRDSLSNGQLQNPVSLIKKLARNRSNSAPPLALSWLKSNNSSRTKLSGADTPPSRTSAVGSAERPSYAEETLQVVYVAEYQQNLNNVQVLLRAPSLNASTPLEFEVIPSEDGALMGCDKFIVKAGSIQSAKLALPAPVVIGPQEINLAGEHYEIKLTVPPLAQVPPDLSPGAPLLDSAQLVAMNPTSFLCSSCSLPIVQCASIEKYLDLPSDHWEEMMDAWMCHPDQKLTDEVTKHTTNGFNPTTGQALVGGSYFLLGQETIVKENVRAITTSDSENDTVVRCLCGASLGRRQTCHSGTVVNYRLAKYSLRPSGSSVEPPKIPLSAYIMADVLELQQAHATHRFIVVDDEDDKPRVLLWVFNPSVRLSYASATHYTLPSDSMLHVSKVFYTLIGPSSAPLSPHSKITDQYPAFKNAETISYPMSICRRLAAMLKESNELYPSSRRSMMHLEVGWLQRS